MRRRGNCWLAIGAAALLLTGSGVTVGCDRDEGALEEAGETVDEAFDDAGDAADEAGEEMRDEMDDAG